MGSEGDPSSFVMPPDTTIGHVSLRVADLPRSLAFYRDVLGFRSVGKPRAGTMFLAADGQAPYLLALEESRREPGPEVTTMKRRAGLYHFALLLPRRRHLSSAVQRLLARESEVHIEGAADHGVSESFYIRDPDFHGIEITRDKPRAEWNMTDHRVQMKTAALDLDELMEQADPSGWSGLPEGTAIGHVHLHVSQLAEALDFYTRGLGLYHTCSYPGAYFYAADEYHHHVATNVWLGEGIPPASREGPGLDHFALKLRRQQELDRAVEHLRRMGVVIEAAAEGGRTRSAFLHDPAGIRIQLYAA